MKYRIIALTFFVCNLCSCTIKEKDRKEKKDIKIETFNVDLDKVYKDKKFPNTNYAMTIQRLEDSEDYPIGHIDKLIVNKKNIYILDQSKAKSVFIYDRNGRLLHVIDYHGRGPGEFSSLQSFDIDKKTGNILIMDASSKKIITYSPKGEYIKEIKYDFFSTNFILDNENNIIMDTGNTSDHENSYYLKKINQNGELLSSYFPSNPSTAGITFNPRNSFQLYKNNIFFLPALSNNIYLLDDEEPILTYQIDFGKDWPSDNFLERMKNTHPLTIRKLMFENGNVCFFNFIQTEDVLHADFYKGEQYSFYLNKKSGKSLLIPMPDDSFSFPLTTYEDEFVCAKYKETGEVVLIFYSVNFDL